MPQSLSEGNEASLGKSCGFAVDTPQKVHSFPQVPGPFEKQKFDRGERGNFDDTEAIDA